MPSAPAGSAIARVSSKMSLMAAQISSVLDQDDLVDALARDAERLGADLAHGDAVGEQRHAVEHDALAGAPAPRCRQLLSSGSTPITRTSGNSGLT